MFPTLSDQAANDIQLLGPGERDLFVAHASPCARAMSLRHAKAYEFALEYARGRNVLDLGCGAGNGAVYLSSVAHVTAVDTDPRLVHLLQKIWPEGGVQWEYVPDGALPFSDSSFDVVTSFQVIEHVSDQLQFLAEIRRVLRQPCGIALITTPNRMLRVGPWQKPWNPHHIRELTSWQLRTLLRTAGFTRIQVLGLDGTSVLTRPERIRCLKQMAGPYWMRLPASVRRMIVHSNGPTHGDDLEDHSAIQSAQSTSTELGAYWWTSRRVCFALDLLGVAHADRASIPLTGRRALHR